MSVKSTVFLIGKLVLLLLIFLVCFSVGGLPMAPYLPDLTPEPGPLAAPLDLIVVGAGHVLVVALAIWRSRWHGWKLIGGLALAYYGLVTFITQVEMWYFLTSLTVSPQLLPLLFLQTLPVVVIFIPLAVVILGKARKPDPDPDADPNPRLMMPVGQWLWKLLVLVLAYEVLYFTAGYFIAWRTPEVQAFYGGTDPGSFWQQMQAVAANDPGLPLFQVLRALLWAGFTLPLVRMLTGKPWQATLIVALFVSVPQNIGHLLANPLIPSNAVRMAHLLETASSTFIYGLLIGWLLHRRHHSLADLFGQSKEPPAIDLTRQPAG